MKLYGVLVLLATLSAACGLRCYSCMNADSKSCAKIATCASTQDRCSSTEVMGLVTKHCINSAACVGLIKCCEGDLCNGAIPTGSSILLLLVSAAITSVFL
ncbi:lymphocyte antigen 6G-like [Acanthopagrus latus]|uniref:lymphocyte antigen 6G-like n=1 Tax=Acanthopagrus latus TaxID=8177 RepID=UPI00187C410B|nr:lymphocyte antigen 6G-like [Acanthopagrus latus]